VGLKVREKVGNPGEGRVSGESPETTGESPVLPTFNHTDERPDVGLVIDSSIFIPSLYVHVPFCARKCAYCAFYSEAGDGALVNRYVQALTREMELVAHELHPQTVFFGGGTPSLLNLRQWEQILQAMDRLNLLGAAEWTIECNPATVSADKARLLRDWGVNRISMGVQSFDASLLERLGRIHSREMVFKSFDILRASGFENVNLDLMFAIPGQTMPVWRATLAEAIALGSEHLACYEVIYEEDTPLFTQLQAGKISPDEDLACAMYEELLAAADAAGFHQYEVANFARGSLTAGAELPERACRHNVNYWRGGSFHGLGPSAAGYVRGQRTTNIANTTLYCEQLERGVRAVASTEELAPLARAGEIAAFGLRMTAGWPLRQFQERTGFDLRVEWAPEIKRMTEMGYAALDDQRFQLTSQGLRFADWAGSEFLRS
jgi:oxygen-independent coproporphyrinogen-3 oxidase